MASQQIALGEGLHSLLRRNSYVDFKVIAEGVEFPCHRVVLAALSPVFDTMFNSDMQVYKLLFMNNYR